MNDTAQTSGEHEVHAETCHKLPGAANRTYLGDFSSCGPAVAAARRIYSDVDGCAICSSSCHDR